MQGGAQRSHLGLQYGSSLLLGSEGLLEDVNVLFAVRELVVQSVQFGPESQQLAVFTTQLLLGLFHLSSTQTA